MERQDRKDSYREQRGDTSRGAESQDRDTSGRSQFEGGRQYEPGGGYGYERQGYAAGQSGQGYYGGRPMSEGAATGLPGGQYTRGEDYGYGRQGGYTPGQSSMSEGTGVGYAGRGRGPEQAGSYRGQYGGRGPKNYRRSDERIQEDVCHLLMQDWGVDASNIEVAVVNCEVTLNGTVPSREQRRRAEDCVEQVAGVSHVQNNVRVARSEGWGSSRDMRYDIARDETDSLISSDKVEGTAVYGSDREKIGSIESVMLTKRGGKVAYAVLSFGGFLGLGTEHYPLPWNILKYDTDLSGYVVNLTKDQLQAAPKYGQNDSWDWNDPATSRQIDQYYSPWMGSVL